MGLSFRGAKSMDGQMRERETQRGGRGHDRTKSMQGTNEMLREEG